MVEETRGKCYSEPVTPVVFKDGCDDWYLEYMILMRVINQTMVWKCTCIYNLWMRGCYSNALCPNGHTCERRQWCDKLLLFFTCCQNWFRNVKWKCRLLSSVKNTYDGNVLSNVSVNLIRSAAALYIKQMLCVDVPIKTCIVWLSKHELN